MLKLSPLGPSPKHQNHRLVRSPKLHSAPEALHFWEFVTPTAEAAGVVHRWKTGPFFLQCGSAEPTRGHSRSPCALIPPPLPRGSPHQNSIALYPFPGPHRFLSFRCIFLLASHKKVKVFCFILTVLILSYSACSVFRVLAVGTTLCTVGCLPSAWFLLTGCLELPLSNTHSLQQPPSPLSRSRPHDSKSTVLKQHGSPERLRFSSAVTPAFPLLFLLERV